MAKGPRNSPTPPTSRTPDLRPDGRLVFSIGASRSGKSQFVLSQVRTSRRLLVWDVEGEYAAKFGLEAVEGRAALLARLRAATGPARLAYHPESLRDFDFFCRCAFNWSRQSPADIVCEELAAATNAVKAGGFWGVLVTRGLKYGTNIYAVVQRAQETDKSVLGNATVVNICRPNTRQDAEYIAGRFGLPLSEIPDCDLQMLQRHKDRTLTKAAIRFESGTGLPYLVKIDKFDRTFADES